MLVLGATALWGLDNNICRIITYNMNIARLVQLKSVFGGSILLVFAAFVLHAPLGVSITQLPQIVVASLLLAEIIEGSFAGSDYCTLAGWFSANLKNRCKGKSDLPRFDHNGIIIYIGVFFHIN